MFNETISSFIFIDQEQSYTSMKHIISQVARLQKTYGGQPINKVFHMWSRLQVMLIAPEIRKHRLKAEKLKHDKDLPCIHEKRETPFA